MISTDSVKEMGKRCPIRLRRFVRTALLAGFTATVAISLHAHADEPRDEAYARRKFNAAMDARTAGDMQAALLDFEEAVRYGHDPRMLYKLAQTELDLGHWRKAAEHFRYYLEQTEPSATDRAAAENRLAEAKNKIGVIEIHVNEQGAEILIDGVVVGTAPLSNEVFVEPGKRIVEARKAGCLFEPKSVEFGPGSKHSVSLLCKRPMVPPRPAMTVPDRGTPNWKKVAIPIAAGVGAVGLGVGIGFRVKADNLSKEADSDFAELAKRTLPLEQICVKHPADCDAIRLKDRKSGTANNVWPPVLIVGGVSAAAALVMALLPAPASNNRVGVVRVVPVVGASERGFGISVSF